MIISRQWENRTAWISACVLAGAAFALFLAAAQGATGGSILPLDDAYIHLQYARQLAAGQPFVYNPGEAPTSGATSLLYPFVVAVGALGGLRGLSLGVWAMFIGAVSFSASILLVYRIARLHARAAVASGVSVIFGFSGLFAWHAMSGMETMLATCFALALFYGIAARRQRWVVWAAVLLAITRPEGAVGALLASGWLTWYAWRQVEAHPRQPWGVRAPRFNSAYLYLPFLAIGVQPLVNLVVTGSAAATGGQAKSLLSAIAPTDVIAERIIANFVRMGRDWLLPPDLRDGLFVIPLLALAALLGTLRRGWGSRGARPSTHQFADVTPGERRRAESFSNEAEQNPSLPLPRTDVAAFVVLWLLGTSALISTLDTAFWHFRRYQIPMMALLFPLGAWGVAVIVSKVGARARWLTSSAIGLALGVTVISALITYGRWVEAYALNAGYVSAQPLAMAEWLDENTPADALVAVHDVGMMRYRGGRETLDMVGLTTPGSAASWRQGPGAVGEWLVAQRPDLIAAYGEGHGLGLNYLQATDLYGESLAGWSVQLRPEDNVALAAATQGIYRPSWSTSESADLPRQRVLQSYWAFPGMEEVDSVDVADLADEEHHQYGWTSTGQREGFPTEFFQFNALDCSDHCTMADGGRRINREETFTVATQPGRALLLVTRVQAAHPGEIDIYVDDTLVGTRVLPFLPGEWFELMTFVAPELIDGETRFRILPRLPDGDYMPYQHWVYQSQFPYTFAICMDPPQALFQLGRFSLNRVDLTVEENRLDVTFNWMNGQPGEMQALGDALVFVHLYGDLDAPPVVQLDRRPANGTLPPGNWLPGMLIDTFMLDLTSIPPGRYRVAVGLYDPYSFTRLQPALAPGALPQFAVARDGRLWVGDIVWGDED